VVNLRVARAVLIAGACTTGCDYVTDGFDTNPFSGDPHPILAEMSTGAIVVGLQEQDQLGLRSAVLDVMSPITVVDRGADDPITVGTHSLTLLGATAPGSELIQPRAFFEDKSVVTLHPCDPTTPTCEIGSLAMPRPFDAMLGIDAFTGDALRIRRATEELFIFPDFAGDDLHRSAACDGVFPSPFRGGGTLLLGGTEITFPNLRIALDTCLAPNPDADTQRERGTDALLVLSTAIGPSLLSRSAYERYRQLRANATAPEYDALPEETVFLPSGPLVGRRTTIPSLALVANLSSNPRAPCRQVYAHHLLTRTGCADDVADCPCEENNYFCAVPAIVEVVPASQISILIVDDSERTLQGLRTELRPDRPEVDGILGTDALHTIELDIDYPHGRLLARCTTPTECSTRVTLSDPESRRYVRGCLDDQSGM
jgi:hypothetical protein